MAAVQRVRVGAGMSAVIALAVAAAGCPKQASVSMPDSGAVPEISVPSASGAAAREPAADPRAAKGRTDPTTWLKDGWLTLQWGMGLADVNDRLRDPKAVVRASRNLDCFGHAPRDEETCQLKVGWSAFTLLEEPTAITCSFAGGRLYAVELEQEAAADEGEAIAQRFGELRELLVNKYGAPERDRRPRKSLGSSPVNATPRGVWTNGFAAWNCEARPNCVEVMTSKSGLLDPPPWSLRIRYEDRLYRDANMEAYRVFRERKAAEKRAEGEKL